MIESHITLICKGGFPMADSLRDIIVNRSNPAMVYISVRPTRYSYNMIKEQGEFVIIQPEMMCHGES